MKHWLFIIVFLAACQSPSRKKKGHSTNPNTATSTVTYVVDGDTFYMNDSTGHNLKVRLIGIDAPETRNNAHGPKGLYAQEAKAWLKERILGQTIRLELDVQRLDKYGRTLAYVFLPDGTFINAELIKTGCAVLYTVPPNVKYADSFYRLQRQARDSGVGLWGR
jgi:micrococcal nuclease